MAGDSWGARLLLPPGALLLPSLLVASVPVEQTQLLFLRNLEHVWQQTVQGLPASAVSC